MNIFLEILYPLTIVIVFFGIIFYVFNPKRKKQYNNDALIPLETETQTQDKEEENK